MPIEKDEGYRLIKSGIAFTTLPNESISAVKSPISLAIWVHLCMKPKDWIVRRSEIMDRFSIGRDKYQECMRELRNLGLVFDVIIRDPSGGFLDKTIICSTTLDPMNIHREPENQAVRREPENPKDGKPERRQIRLLSKERVITKERIYTNKTRKGSDRKGTLEELMDTSWADQLITEGFGPSD